MFIPAAGYYYGSDIYDVKSKGFLWTSSLRLIAPSLAWCFGIRSSDISMYN